MEILYTVLFALQIFCGYFSDGAGLCGGDQPVGITTNNTLDDFTKTENITNVGVLLLGSSNTQKYIISCCGTLTTWHWYGVYSGDIYLQVWRNTGTTWQLVGENHYSSVTGVETKNVAVTDQITVKDGDVLGWYTPDDQVVGYATIGWKVYQTTSLGRGTSYDWETGSTQVQQYYGVGATVSGGTGPNFTNLDAAESLYTHESLTFVVTVTNTENITMTTSPSGFDFDPSTNTLTNTSPMVAGTYEFEFTASDSCQNDVKAKYTLTVTNIPPEIHNLPSGIDVHESQTTLLNLYELNVTDASGDDVTCSISSSTPASSDFLVIKSGTVNSIYVNSNPTFDYDTDKHYELTVSCTDGPNVVTGKYHVFLLRNEPPVITNLPATQQVSWKTTTSGDDIFTVTSTDAENDDVTYSMTCVPSSCPFSIRSSGLVEATSSLIGTTNPAYDLYIYANDGRTPVGPRVLTLTISDINIPPEITNLPLPSAISIQENSPTGTSVFKPIIKDLNAGDTHTITVTYDPASGSSLFSHDSDGQISVSANINYEDLTTKTFTVDIAVDDGYASVTESFDVTIVNTNEAPSFPVPEYNLYGEEGDAGKVVGIPSFAVTDPDGDSVSYTIDCAQFHIDSATRQVTLAAKYDLDLAGASDTVTCTVTVSDGELNDTTSLNIVLENINDNSPVFSFVPAVMYVSGTSGVGETIGNMAATDLDEGLYGVITYSLDQTSLTEEYFGIMPTGQVYIKSDLSDFVNRTTVVLPVNATDGGGRVATSSVTIIIQELPVTEPVISNERFITFFEDPRNIAWFVPTLAVLMFSVVFSLYQAYKAGVLDKLACSSCDRIFLKKPRISKRQITKLPERRWENPPTPMKSVTPPTPATPPTPPTPALPKDDFTPRWNPWSNDDKI